MIINDFFQFYFNIFFIISFLNGIYNFSIFGDMNLVSKIIFFFCYSYYVFMNVVFKDISVVVRYLMLI